MLRLAPSAMVVASMLALMGCSKGVEKKGPLVAKGKEVAVTAEEFKARLDEQSPFIRARYASLERKKEFLDNLIRFELLAAEAKRRKLEQDPEVQVAIQKLLVQRLVRTAFDEKSGVAEVPEAEARKYYDERIEEFVKPERVRLSLVFLRAEAGSSVRSAKFAELKKRLAVLKAEEARNPIAFGNMARDLSDDAASKAAGGDLGFRTRQELEQAYAKTVAEAAFGLKEVGKVTGVVEGPQGLYVLKLGARQPPSSRTFDEVKGQLVARLGRERRTKDFDEFVRKLRTEADVKVMDSELEKVAVGTTVSPPERTAAAPAP